MAQLSYPFENQDTTETQYSYLFGALQENGVVGLADDAGSLYAAVTGSGMTTIVYAGLAYIRGFLYQNTSDVTLTHDPATSQPRIDIVVLRLDPSVNSIVAVIKKGTAAASPSAPSLTQTAEGVFELPLLQVLVPASATALSPSDTTNLIRYVGRGIGFWRTASRPASPWFGQVGYNATLGKFEWYDKATLSWKTQFPLDVPATAIADNSVTDAKLVTKPGNYVGVRTEASTITLGASDVGKLIVYTGSTGATVTLFGAAFTTGQRIDFIQDGTGQITFQAGASNFLKAPGGKNKTKGQYSAASIVYLGSNNFVVAGDLSV